jgi:hypothetical protein
MRCLAPASSEELHAPNIKKELPVNQLVHVGIATLTATMVAAIAIACPPDEESGPSAAPAPPPPEIFVEAEDDNAPSDYKADPRYGLLTPLPETGLPPVLAMRDGPTADELAYRARLRGYAKQINLIRHKHFGKIKVDRIRKEGIEQLREFTDPAAFRPLLELLAREDDDVRLAVLDHLAQQDELGQAALAWAAIYDNDGAIRHEASRRLDTPAPPAVLQVLDAGLRSEDDVYANNAGSLTGMLDAVPLIPVMVAAQAAPRDVEGAGDLAWIAIGRQEVFVAGLVPVVGDNSGAFQPILGTVQTGTVVRIMDAVVIVYRAYIHDSLVTMTTRETGQSTKELGYDVAAWREWYNTVYVPMMQERIKLAELSKEPEEG